MASILSTKIFNASYIFNRCLKHLADKQNSTMTSKEIKYMEDVEKNESKSDVITFCQNNMSSDNLPAIVGLLVAVIVLMILLGLAVVLFIRLRKKGVKKRRKGKLRTLIVCKFLKPNKFL